MAKRRKRRSRQEQRTAAWFRDSYAHASERNVSLINELEGLKLQRINLQRERGELLQRNAHLEGMLRAKDALAHDIQALTNVVTKLALRLVETTEP